MPLEAIISEYHTIIMIKAVFILSLQSHGKRINRIASGDF